MRDAMWMVEIRPFAQKQAFLVCFGWDETEARRFEAKAKERSKTKPCHVTRWDMMSGTPVREK